MKIKVINCHCKKSMCFNVFLGEKKTSGKGELKWLKQKQLRQRPIQQ